MLIFIALLLLGVSGGQAFASDCPDRYRFVDFGLEGRDAVIRRGGTIFRAFGSGGTHLLVRDGTVCRAVEELSRDGRGLPIPVVSGIVIDPAIAGLDVQDLRLTATEDAVAAAEANAVAHREKLARTDTITTPGPDFLCARTPGTQALSCQIVSPYAGNIALVIYCDALTCEMPVLARDEQLVVTASWRWHATDPAAAGQAISDKVQRIFDFLEEQI